MTLLSLILRDITKQRWATSVKCSNLTTLYFQILEQEDLSKLREMPRGRIGWLLKIICSRWMHSQLEGSQWRLNMCQSSNTSFQTGLKYSQCQSNNIMAKISFKDLNSEDFFLPIIRKLLESELLDVSIAWTKTLWASSIKLNPSRGRYHKKDCSNNIIKRPLN